MEDFELYQKGECLEDPEVISRRQEVHSAWSRLQLLVEEREALIRKAINYHKTIAEVNEVLDGLENEWMKSGNDDYIKGKHPRFTHLRLIHLIFRAAIGSTGKWNWKTCIQTKINSSGNLSR